MRIYVDILNTIFYIFDTFFNLFISFIYLFIYLFNIIYGFRCQHFNGTKTLLPQSQ